MSNKQQQQQTQHTTNLRVLNQSFIDAATAYRHDVWMKAAERLHSVKHQLSKLSTIDVDADERALLLAELKGLTKILEVSQP